MVRWFLPRANETVRSPPIEAPAVPRQCLAAQMSARSFRVGQRSATRPALGREAGQQPFLRPQARRLLSGPQPASGGIETTRTRAAQQPPQALAPAGQHPTKATSDTAACSRMSREPVPSPRLTTLPHGRAVASRAAYRTARAIFDLAAEAAATPLAGQCEPCSRTSDIRG